MIPIKEEKIEVVVHSTSNPFIPATDGQKKAEHHKASMELLANNPEVFTDGVLQSDDIRLDIPHLTSTEAAIVVEAARVIHKWNEFVMLIFQIYPHDRVTINMKRVEHLWPHVLRFQGKDPEQ